MSAQPMTVDRWSRMSWRARQQWLDAAERRRRQLLEPLQDEVARLKAEIAQLRSERHTLSGLRYVGPRTVHADPADWTPEELLGAHAAWKRGDRDEWSTTGHRIWDRERKRREYRARQASR